MALERRLGRQDSLLAALDVLLIGHRETAVSVEGNGIFLRHMYAALRLELPAAVGPDQRDRNDLLIVSDMFQVRERRVELGHIEVGVIADFAKPVVPVLLRRAGDVVFIVLAEQAVGLRMLLRIIYIALDQNSHFSHFKLFQLVSRRGFGRGLGGSRLCVLYLDFSFTVVQNPLAILVADHKLQRCLARIVELMRLRCFAVVLCDIRRGLDGYVVFPRLIQSRRFRPVERIVRRVVDQVVVFRPAVGGADVLYLNLPDSGFQIVIGGGNGSVRHGRVVLLPDGVDDLGAVFMLNVNRAARPILRLGRIRTVSPALEGVVCLGRGLIGNGKGNLVHRWSRCRTRLISRRIGAAIRIIPQFKEWHPDRVDGLDRIVLGQRNLFAAEVLRSRSSRLVSPTSEGIAVAGRRLRGNGESMGLLILRGRLVGLAGRCAGAVVGIIVQRESQQNGRAFEIVICGVLAVGKQGVCALAASVAAASGPTDVVDLVIVNTLPDILCIGKTEGIVVDVVLAEVNGDVIAADA